MKLQCDVEIVSRLLPTCGLKSRGKGTRALLSIGKHVDKSTQRSHVYLMVCTQKDRAGSRYKLKENIEKFFTLFVEEGKATVRLKEPAVDVCLSKADANSLKSFLSAARLADRGVKADTLALSTLAPVRARDVERPKKKLSILSKKDYPLTSGFPHSLEQLQVSYCRLSRVDMRMLCLHGLRRLDLSNNHIGKLPVALANMCLVELLLHDNHLEAFGDELCRGGLRLTLQLLDLSRNRLQALPNSFCQLQKLVTLKVDHNLLERLPEPLGRLGKLRFLSAAHNRLLHLPATFHQLSLENLDLFGNPFGQVNTLDPVMRLTFPPPLQELACRVVLRHRITYGPQLIPAHLCRELELAHTCDCGHACISSYVQTAANMNLHQVSHTVVLVDSMGGTEAPIQRYFCSLTCYSHFLDGCLQRGLR